MKQNIHPDWHNDCQVTCVCGNTFTTGSTYPQIQVEICAACHPFFTGEMKFVDTQGRVERFMQKRQESAAKREATLAAKKAKQAKHRAEEPATDPQSFKQILSQTKTAMTKTETAKAAEPKKTAKTDTKTEKKAPATPAPKKVEKKATTPVEKAA